MRFVLFLFTLTILINRPVSNAMVLANFQQEALAEHNVLREKHCTGPMTLDSSLNTVAQNYAQYLAVNNLFNHSKTPGLGENLFQISSSNAITYLNGSTPTDSWYSEISSYNYNNPVFSGATGHFTQVIWKNSVQLGIGIAFSSDNMTAWVVAEYAPPGNVQGQFPANVLQLCSNHLGGD